MFSWIRFSFLLSLFAALLALPLQAQNSEQLEVGPPPLHRVEPPAPGASPEELEKRGDELRTEKNFLDALDFYEAALNREPTNTSLVQKNWGLPADDAALQRSQEELRTRHPR